MDGRVKATSESHLTPNIRLLSHANTINQAYELSVLTGTQVLLLVVSETGLVYTFTTPKLQPLVTKAEGKNLIQVTNEASHQLPKTCSLSNRLVSMLRSRRVIIRMGWKARNLETHQRTLPTHSPRNHHQACRETVACQRMAVLLRSNSIK